MLPAANPTSVQYVALLASLDLAEGLMSGNVLFSTHANIVMFLLTVQIQRHCIYWVFTLTVKRDISLA